MAQKRAKRTTKKKSTRSRYSSKAKSSVSRHIRKHKRKGMPQRQAVAAAMSEQRRKGRKVPPRGGRKAKARS